MTTDTTAEHWDSDPTRSPQILRLLKTRRRPRTGATTASR